MRAKVLIVTTLSAIVLAWLVAVSLSLRESASGLTEFDLSPTPAASSPPERLDAERGQAQTVDRNGTGADYSLTLRDEIAEDLDEAWGCFRAEDFICSRVVLSRLNGIRDLNSLERAQILYVAATLEAAQGRREDAIRILRDQIPALADLSNEFQARVQGMLAGMYFQEGRYAEALDTVNDAIELSPSDSLLQMRDNMITAKSLRSRDRLGESPIDPGNLSLIDEIVE